MLARSPIVLSVSAGGHYAGTTAQGEPISFDVVDEGTAVTNVVVVFTATPVGRPAVLTITRQLPVDVRGRWTAVFKSAGFDGHLSGQISSSEAGTGSLRLDPGGSIAWQAKRVTAVLPASG